MIFYRNKMHACSQNIDFKLSCWISRICCCVSLISTTHIPNESEVRILNLGDETGEAMTRAVRVGIPIGGDTQHSIRTRSGERKEVVP